MPDLTLTGAQVRRLVGLIRVLIAPLDYESETAWSNAVTKRLLTALGTDRSGVVLRAGDRASMVGTWGERAAAEYMQRWYATMPGDVRRRAARMTSWVRSDVWSFADLRRGAYYHEWCVPNGNQDSAGMCVYEPTGEVAVYINSSRSGHFVRGGHHAMLLEMLQPSLAAGVAILRGIGPARDDPRLLDTASSALGIFRLDGKLLHAVPKFAVLLRNEREGPIILSAARNLIRKMDASLRDGRRQICSPKLVVQTSTSRYVLLVSMADSAALGVERLCIVSIEATRRRSTKDSMPERFALSPREADVASLLAMGYRNAAIASALGISEHTARHHTERILNKLGVSSRAAVAARLKDWT